MTYPLAARLVSDPHRIADKPLRSPYYRCYPHVIDSIPTWSRFICAGRERRVIVGTMSEDATVTFRD